MAIKAIPIFGRQPQWGSFLDKTTRKAIVDTQRGAGGRAEFRGVKVLGAIINGAKGVAYSPQPYGTERPL